MVPSFRHGAHEGETTCFCYSLRKLVRVILDLPVGTASGLVESMVCMLTRFMMRHLSGEVIEDFITCARPEALVGSYIRLCIEAIQTKQPFLGIAVVVASSSSASADTPVVSKLLRDRAIDCYLREQRASLKTKVAVLRASGEFGGTTDAGVKKLAEKLGMHTTLNSRSFILSWPRTAPFTVKEMQLVFMLQKVLGRLMM